MQTNQSESQHSDILNCDQKVRRACALPQKQHFTYKSQPPTANSKLIMYTTLLRSCLCVRTSINHTTSMWPESVRIRALTLTAAGKCLAGSQKVKSSRVEGAPERWLEGVAGCSSLNLSAPWRHPQCVHAFIENAKTDFFCECHPRKRVGLRLWLRVRPCRRARGRRAGVRMKHWKELAGVCNRLDASARHVA